MVVAGQARLKTQRTNTTEIVKKVRANTVPILLYTPLVTKTGNAIKVIMPCSGTLADLLVHVGAITNKDGPKQALFNLTHAKGAERDGYAAWLSQGKTLEAEYSCKVRKGELLIFYFSQYREDADIMDVSISFNLVSNGPAES